MTDQPTIELSPAEFDVLRERSRQVAHEGYDAAHDDEHDLGELARAGAAYTLMAAAQIYGPNAMILSGSTVPVWPFEGLPKATDTRQALVRGAALLLAEIERLDRLAAKTA